MGIFKKPLFSEWIYPFALMVFIGQNGFAQDAAGQKNAAIFPFHFASTNIEEKQAISELDGLFYDLFAGQLISTDYFRIVDRRHISETLQEIKLQQSGLTDGEIVQAGKIIGAQLAIFGTVTKVGKETYLSLKIIDIETSLILRAVNIRGSLDRPDRLAMDAGSAFMEGLSRVLYEKYDIGTGQVTDDLRRGLKYFLDARDKVQQAILAQQSDRQSRADKLLDEAEKLLAAAASQSAELETTVKLYRKKTSLLSDI